MSEVAPWDRTTDGVSRAVTAATTLSLRITGDDETYSESEAHVVLADSRVQWFTDCATPLPGAP